MGGKEGRGGILGRWLEFIYPLSLLLVSVKRGGMICWAHGVRSGTIFRIGLFIWHHFMYSDHSMIALLIHIHILRSKLVDFLMNSGRGSGR